MKQEMMGWQWHHLAHMQIICTLLQRGNHASASPFTFYRLDAHLDSQQTVSKTSRLVGWLEFNVPFQHKYSYIRDETSGMESYPYPVKEG